MCGIAGLFWKNERGRCPEEFRVAAASIAHRGPDAHGEFLDDRGILIHYRLSILDLSEAGNQPFRDPSSPCIGVYNGELYNFRDLANRYKLNLDSHSDTEVLFRLLHTYGESIVPHYNGIFGFASYDYRKGSLLLARDRMGVKPLYYIDAPDYFAFASEAKVLYQFMATLPISTAVLQEFLLFGSSLSEQTIVQGVRKLKSGTTLRVDLSHFGSQHSPFWSVESHIAQSPPLQNKPHEIKHSIRRVLKEAVTRQCISDVPVGAYLSGGIDSSVVVALASQNMGSRLSTYSVSFEGSDESELGLARMVAEKYGTDHHEFQVGVRHLEHELEALILQYDEPFADPAIIPLHLMAQKCAPLSKVVLQGDGGDELFAGYGRHLDLSQRWRRAIAFKSLALLHPSKTRRKAMASRARPLLTPSAARRLALLSGMSTNRDLSISVLSDGLREQLRSHDPLQSFYPCAKSLSGVDALQQMLYTDLQVILPNRFLEKVDKVSMWHGIEARVPLLDDMLVNYVMRIPSKLKVSGGQTKRLLRKVASDLLPKELLEARKQSFGTPMGTWLRTTLSGFVERVFERGRKDWSEIIDFDHLSVLFDQHLNKQANHSAILWRATVLLTWLDHYKQKVQVEIEPNESETP